MIRSRRKRARERVLDESGATNIPDLDLSTTLRVASSSDSSNHGPQLSVPLPVVAIQPVKDVDRRVALGDRTRQRIIEAAEFLFAQRGYDAVSLRDIIAAAGVNSAAIYYHFKSKEGLLFSILRMRGASIASIRMQNLAALKARGSFSLTDVLIAFLRPAIYDERNGLSIRSHYADIRTRMSTERLSTVLSIQGEIFDESTREYLTVLHELLPHLTPREMFFRFDFMLGLMLHAMSNNGRIGDVSLGEVNSSDPEEVLRHLIPFIEAGFRGEAAA